MTRTGIVATIGPATNNPSALRALHAAGMTVARLNGSHNDLAWHRDTIRLIRETLPGLPILLDIPGRKIRTVQLAVEPRFEAGEVIVLTTDPDHDGSRKVPVNYGNLHQDVAAGAVIFADDGTLSFTVAAVEGRDIHCRAANAGKLRSRKGINVPGISLRTELVTDRDRAMVAFARDNGVDFIGISFVETARHVELIRGLTGGAWPRIVAKVENQGGLDHLAEIVAATDVVMIDRGDLSVETSVEEVALWQKHILDVARRHGKPVIVATEMLHSMIDNPFPTKAEVSDITNAVLDGAAATMLSGETAVGRYPVEAVACMRRILAAAERHIDERKAAQDSAAPIPAPGPADVGAAMTLLSRSLPITKIVAVSRTGHAARLVATQHPRQPILAVSDDAVAARSFNLLPGTRGFHADIPAPRPGADFVTACVEWLWRQGEIAADDVILVVAASRSGGLEHLNVLQSHVAGDLAAALGWTRAAA